MGLGFYYRTMRGGHWEKWDISGLTFSMWFRLQECSLKTGARPHGVRGEPECEDHSPVLYNS